MPYASDLQKELTRDSAQVMLPRRRMSGKRTAPLMRSFAKYLRLLLLPALLYWGSGAAQFLHELTEHAHVRPDEDQSRALSSAASAHHDGDDGEGDNHSQGGHDHEHCATCQMLAVMRCGSPIAAPPPLPALDCVATVIVQLQHRPHILPTFQLPPSRAPPTTVL